MSLLIMQHPAELDLEEIELSLYSQVFHSTENWDQTPDHPVLSKVPERQVTTYSINKHTVNSARYWDGTTKNPPPSNINAVNNTAVVKKTTTETTTEPSETNDNDNTLQNNNDKNISRKVGLVEEYIGFDSTNNQNAANRNETNIDFSKDDFHNHRNFFSNAQDKLIQQSEAQSIFGITPNNINNNSTVNNQCDSLENPFAELIEKIKLLEQENTVASLRKAKNLTVKLKRKQTKHKRQIKQLLKNQLKEEKQLRKLGLLPKNNAKKSFSFVNQFNNIQRKTTPVKQNVSVDKSPGNSNRQSPIVEQVEINESPKNEQKEIIHLNDSLVISSDNDSDDSDDVIEVPLPAEEIVCIDSSSEISDTDDSVCVDDNIVENIPKTPTTSTNNSQSTPTTSKSITEENTVPNCIKLENLNDSKTTEISNKSQLEIDGEINNSTKKQQILNTEENKTDKIETMKDIEENATTLSENEEKINETKSPKQTRNSSNISINEIEKERAEFLCTPDSNTNDFMAHDECNLNRSNFSFNFNLHDSDLGTSGKEIPKSGPSITDVYETESSCSEAGTTSKNQSYFNEVDFESPNKEIFAEPDLAKFSSFITPIRNRNISNVANSATDLTPIKTKAGVINTSSFQLNLYNNDVEGSRSSDEYNSDPTTLPVKKKMKKKKKKAKKKDANETTENQIDDNVVQEQTEVPNDAAEINKPKKNKRRRKAITYEELKNECLLSNQPNSEPEKMSKSKERRLKKKNKRKSAQLENGLDPDSSSKKPKNVANASKEKCDAQTKQNVENKQDTQNTNKDNIESLSNTNKNVSETLEELNSTVDYYDKVDSYFADDILYKELKDMKTPEECSSDNLKKNETQIVDDDKDSSGNEQSDIDALSNNSETNREKFSYTDKFRKANENDAEIIDISSDSDTQITHQIESTSSNSDSNIVLNIFSPEKSKNVNESENIVANPFSFVQNFEKLNNKKSFKDCWTNDMSTFYNESWGHEEYDITEVHKSMPSDFSKWSVSIADQYPLKGKKRGPKCLRCQEFGHLQFRCPKLHDAVKCTTCGESEHTSTRCPNSICTTCRCSTQHHTTSCNNCSNYKTIRCPICNYIGHLSKDCPDLWRRYHLTTSDNNSLIESSEMLKPPNMLWCSNCANRGHSANNCNYLRTDHFPTYPGIQNYTPVYNTVFETPAEPQIPVSIFENVNLSQIRNYRTELTKNNNKKYLNIIKNLRRNLDKNCGDLNLNKRLNYLQNAANNNRFNKHKIGELYRISKILKNSK